MKVKVYYPNWNEKVRCHVATVNVKDDLSPEAALEYAYRWTQNIDGSWSGGETMSDYFNFNPSMMVDNPDYNPNVEVVEPRFVDGTGKVWGHRSSMIGDDFEINGKVYRVATFGFDEVE